MAYKQNLVNHVMLALDGSLSMSHLREAVIRVTDGLVKRLADVSVAMKQETRVSIILFGSDVQCIVWDMDVLRLPSIRDLYHIGGNTALCAATMRGIKDHREIPTRYGDHAFLGFTITDGEENYSRYVDPNAVRDLPEVLENLEDNWSFACLVPDSMAALHARQYGFPAGCIEKWDATSRRGIEEAGERIGNATERWMTGRASGVRGTRNVFDTSAARVNAQTVATSLEPLAPTSFRILPVPTDIEMRHLMEQHGFTYVNGDCYYELFKTETVQKHKNVIVVERATERAYGGQHARDLIGLPPGVDVRVTPNQNPAFAIFVQSTAPNRKPRPGKRALILLAHQPQRTAV